jgi:anti-anti-sigma factor
MSVTYQIDQEIATVRPSGRLDAHTAPRLGAVLAEQVLQSPYAIVDMQDVHFIDSSALGTLVQGLKRFRARGGDLMLASLQQPVRIIFELTRLSDAFLIYPDADQARRAAAGK